MTPERDDQQLLARSIFILILVVFAVMCSFHITVPFSPQS